MISIFLSLFISLLLGGVCMHDEAWILLLERKPTSPGESLDFGHDVPGRVNSLAPVIAPAPDMGHPAVAFLHNAHGLLDEEISNGVTTTYGYARNTTGPYGPNGKWQEPGGLVNDGFRHRDLHTATFLSRDPAGFIDGPNTYNYVGHNPWSAFDPHGLASTIPVTAAEIGYAGESASSVSECLLGWDTGIGGPGTSTYSATLDDTGTTWGPAAGILSPLDQAVMTENTRVFAASGGIQNFDYRYQDAFEKLLWVYSFQVPYVSEEVRRLNELADGLMAEADEIERDTGLDIAGMIDPSGTIDLGNSIRLWNQGRWFDSVLTAAGVAPVVGDFLGKGVKSGRKGFKALINSSDLAAVAPNSAGRGPVIIGETMKRVVAAAEGIPGAKILNDMPKFTGNADQVTSQMMQYNRKWILEQMRSGRPIIDIGTDAARQTPSIFYQMEQNMLKNYQKLHPGSLNISTP